MIKQVMLAAKVDPDNPELALAQLAALRYPVIASPKIDGIRCHTNGGVLSRKNKPIPNWFVRSYLFDQLLRDLDGELIVGSPFSPSCFNTTQSGVMSSHGDPGFKYLVFDEIDETGRLTFEERLDHIHARLSQLKDHTRVIQVPQRYIYSVEELLKFETRCVVKGWEGIMIRDPRGIYKQGRSTLREGILIKVKRFVDGEAEILGSYEQETNLNEASINEVGRSKRSSHQENKIPNDHLGGFNVRDVKTGQEFKIGTFQGFTQEDRFDMWNRILLTPNCYNGKIVKYKFFPVGVKIKPRHPILVGFRNPIDM